MRLVPSPPCGSSRAVRVRLGERMGGAFMGDCMLVGLQQMAAAAQGAGARAKRPPLPLLAAAAAAGDPERYRARLQRSFPALAFTVCPLLGTTPATCLAVSRAPCRSATCQASTSQASPPVTPPHTAGAGPSWHQHPTRQNALAASSISSSGLEVAAFGGGAAARLRAGKVRGRACPAPLKPPTNTECPQRSTIT